MNPTNFVYEKLITFGTIRRETNMMPNPKRTKIEFPNGKELSKVTSATCLGGNLQANGASKTETEGRISKAAVVFNKLRSLWNDAACSLTWKLRVYDAVVL